MSGCPKSFAGFVGWRERFESCRLHRTFSLPPTYFFESHPLPRCQTFLYLTITDQHCTIFYHTSYFMSAVNAIPHNQPANATKILYTQYIPQHNPNIFMLEKPTVLLPRRLSRPLNKFLPHNPQPIFQVYSRNRYYYY